LPMYPIKDFWEDRIGANATHQFIQTALDRNQLSRW